MRQYVVSGVSIAYVDMFIRHCKQLKYVYFQLDTEYHNNSQTVIHFFYLFS